MFAQWTPEQVLALAPDAASAKNGRGLATLRKWSSLGRCPSIIWGECQGSGKDPYRTQIDLSEPAFRCSCPSRKFPCKHGLGLFLLLAENPQSFAEKEPPEWVVEWLKARSQRTKKQAEEQTQQPERAGDAIAQAKRVAARQRKVSAGIQELRLWLEDRIRQGLATMQQDSYQVWDRVAARMMDAQAPGLARQLRELASLAGVGTERLDDLLEQLGQLYLITEGFERSESLPAEVQADLRTQIGWTISQEEVLSGKPYADLWLVVGQRTQVEERLKLRRTWLFGLATGKFALLLDFAHGQQPFEQSFLSGACLEAELVFYPSAYPLRALIKTRHESGLPSQHPSGVQITQAIAAYSQAFSACPWLEQFPVLLETVVPMRDRDRWLIQDAEAVVLSLSSQLQPKQGWQLLALSGGYPLTLFGEWNGTQLLPLSVWAAEVFYELK